MKNATRKVQYGSIRVTIPNEVLIDGGLFQQGGYTLMLQSLSQDNQYLISDEYGTDYNVAKINSIQPMFVQAILNEAINNGKVGYEITIMNHLSGNIPYVRIDKALLEKVPSFLNIKGEDASTIKLKDYTISYVDDIKDETKVYVEIGHYPDSHNRFNYTTWEEIKQWAIEYGIENVKITDKVSNQIEDLVV